MDELVEEGGVRETTQARVFLKIAPSDEDLEDQFENIGVPNPGLWIVRSGSPSVDGVDLLMKHNATPGLEDDIISIQKFQSRDADGTQDEEFWMTLEVELDTTGGGFAGQMIGFWLDDDNNIFLRIDGNNQITYHSEKDGNVSESSPIGISPVGVYVWKIQAQWDSQTVFIRRIRFWRDALLLETITDLNTIPTIPMQAFINGGSQSTSGNPMKADYITVTNAIEYIGPEDQIEARGKRWAIMKSILTTHLQTELLVQEVIP